MTSDSQPPTPDLRPSTNSGTLSRMSSDHDPEQSPSDLALQQGGRVTAIKPQVRHPDRVSVFLDGAFAFGLPAEAAARDGLTVGEEITADRVQTLLGIDEAAKATTAALAFLAHRPRAEREVRDRLRQKGYGPTAIERAIEKLYGWQYLDDADFARTWVENRTTHRPRGPRLLEQELRQKGIDRETARETIAAAAIDETAAALDLARAKLRTYQGQEPTVIRRRLSGYLARRGFSYATVGPVLDRVLGGEQHDAEFSDPPPDES